MRIATLAAAGVSFLAAAAPHAQNIVITGVFDGPLAGGTPKVVEFYVINPVADLSRYAFGSANNGGGTDGAEFTFPAGAAAAGRYLELVTEAPNFRAYFGFDADFVNGAAAVNGDDAVELFFDANGDGTFTASEVIDTFGDLTYGANDGPTLPWNYMDGWAYRKNGTGPGGATFTVGNWTYSGQNATDGATSNDAAASRFPIRSYSRNATASDETAVGSLTLSVANPVRGAAQVRFSTAAAQPARLSVYDVLGRQVATLADGVVSGSQTATLETSRLSPGVYVLRLTAGADVLTRTVTVVR